VRRLLRRRAWPGILISRARRCAPGRLPLRGERRDGDLLLAIFAVSLGLIISYAGLVSLGRAAFFGAGSLHGSCSGKDREHLRITPSSPPFSSAASRPSSPGALFVIPGRTS